MYRDTLFYERIDWPINHTPKISASTTPHINIKREPVRNIRRGEQAIFETEGEADAKPGEQDLVNATTAMRLIAH